MKTAELKIPSKPRVRKHLSADALFRTVRRQLEKVPDIRTDNVNIPLSDALMSAFAMFSLKDPSLLAFERRRKAEEENLKSIYGLEAIPSDTQMRTILDEVLPQDLSPSFRAVFAQLQRGKALEQMTYLGDYYLMPLDGTGYFSSEKLQSPACMEKTNSKTGNTLYYLQMLGAAIVHPDRKEVIPLMPEIISKQDGASKNDCEMNASRRFLTKFKQEHPHLKIIVTQDSISPNGPYIQFLKEHDFRFILCVKQTDHAFLFKALDKAVRKGEAKGLVIDDQNDPEKFHIFRWAHALPLNASHQDILVNVLEYWQLKGREYTYFSWVTDLTLTEENVYAVMRAGRARWKIENETFNTLKNQGYHLEHNYGLGQKHLSKVFVSLMMLAFLVDQTQQLCCSLFQTVWKEMGTKRELWEMIRSLFRLIRFDSMECLYRAILLKGKLILAFDTS